MLLSIRSLTFTAIAFGLLLPLTISPSDAQQVMSYQAVVANLGNQLQDAHNVTFTVYSDSTDGNSVFKESMKDVLFSNGFFCVLIGEDQNNPLPKLNLNSVQSAPTQYFVALSIDGGAELAPRSRLASGASRLWRRTADSSRAAAEATLPSLQSGVACLALNGKIYVIGGSGFGDNKTHIYDPATNRWSADSAPPVMQAFMASGVVRQKIYVIGGWSGSKDNNQIYDPASGKWSTGAALPIGMQDLSSAVIQDKIYVVGGDDAGTLQIYDANKNKWSKGASMPVPEGQVSVATVNNKLFVIGGSGPATNIQIYEPATNRWKTGKPLPIGVSTARSAVVNGKIYVMGGFGYDRDDMNQIYDPAANQWSNGAPLPVGTSDGLTAVLNGKIFLISAPSSNGIAVWAYDPVKNKWAFVPGNLRDSIFVAASSASITSASPGPTGQWKRAIGLANSQGSNSVLGFIRYGKYLLASAGCLGNGHGATRDSLFISSDDGRSWTNFAPNGGSPLFAFGSLSAPVLIGTTYDTAKVDFPRPVLSCSTDLGQTWKLDTIGWSLNGLPMAMASVGNTAFMATATGIFQQDVPGSHWTPTPGMSGGGGFLPVTSLVASGDTLFAALGMMGGILVSTNKGASWTRINNGLPRISYEGWGSGQAVAADLTHSGSSFFALIAHDSTRATYDLYRTTNLGTSWMRMNTTPLDLGLFSSGTKCLTAYGQNLFAESTQAGIFVSTDTGRTWFDANQGLPVYEPNPPPVTTVTMHGDTVSTSTDFSFSSASFNDLQFSGMQIAGENLLIGTSSGILIRKLSDFGIH